MDKNIENYLKNKDITNIMSAACWPYSYNIDKDEISSLQMDTLWSCIQKYDLNSLLIYINSFLSPYGLRLRKRRRSMLVKK